MTLGELTEDMTLLNEGPTLGGRRQLRGNQTVRSGNSTVLGPGELGSGDTRESSQIGAYTADA
jgi:hypothetical protein